MSVNPRPESAEKGALAAIVSLLPAECWVSRSDAVFCTDFVGGSLGGSDATFVEDMCCLPCQLRAVLASVLLPGGAERMSTESEREWRELLTDKIFQEALLATAGHMETQWISPECRTNRTVDGAWDEAVRRLREIYDAQVKHDPTIVLGLSIGRQTTSQKARVTSPRSSAP